MISELVISEINKIFECDILAPNRLQNNVDGRIAFSKFMRINSDLSLQKIGKLIDRNHSTIIHHLDSHKQLMAYDKKYRKRYREISICSKFKRWLCVECVFEIKTIKL